MSYVYIKEMMYVKDTLFYDGGIYLKWLVVSKSCF